MYPSWSYYPRNIRPPEWTGEFVDVVSDVEGAISTVGATLARLRSDEVLAAMAAGLAASGYAVEIGDCGLPARCPAQSGHRAGGLAARQDGRY